VAEWILIDWSLLVLHPIQEDRVGTVPLAQQYQDSRGQKRCHGVKKRLKKSQSLNCNDCILICIHDFNNIIYYIIYLYKYILYNNIITYNIYLDCFKHLSNHFWVPAKGLHTSFWSAGCFPFTPLQCWGEAIAVPTGLGISSIPKFSIANNCISIICLWGLPPSVFK